MGAYHDTIKIVFLCVVWFSFSSATNIIGKQILTVFPYPTTLTMVQLMVINCFLGPAMTLLSVKESPYVSRQQFMRRVVPLGVGKIMASVSAYISILKVPVSYSHTGMSHITCEHYCSHGNNVRYERIMTLSVLAYPNGIMTDMLYCIHSMMYC